jgi:hypothetical protein
MVLSLTDHFDAMNGFGLAVQQKHLMRLAAVVRNWAVVRMNLGTNQSQHCQAINPLFGDCKNI